jgi:hypothetical protein
MTVCCLVGNFKNMEISLDDYSSYLIVIKIRWNQAVYGCIPITNIVMSDVPI